MFQQPKLLELQVAVFIKSQMLQVVNVSILIMVMTKMIQIFTSGLMTVLLNRNLKLYMMLLTITEMVDTDFTQRQVQTATIEF